ncbi:hypothetical protein HanIR_Chr15g0733071 [Helianthus annuus]|nr:hypothetical protein HanIR_Chr15g0733071 [Helianthus annuus]
MMPWRTFDSKHPNLQNLWISSKSFIENAKIVGIRHQRPIVGVIKSNNPFYFIVYLHDIY